MIGEVKYLNRNQARAFISLRHYSGRLPNIVWAFGWFINGGVVAALTVGKPASPNLCIGVCGEEYKDNVYELNRLCRVDELEEQLSQFVSACLRRLSGENIIIVSYADTEMNHHGYIYQACNFIYTGATLPRTDMYTDGNKHSRHTRKDEQTGNRKVRSSKHRYIFFAMNDKKLKMKAKKALNYDVCPYPKGDNKNYVLGEYLKPNIIGDVELLPQRQGELI